MLDKKAALGLIGEKLVAQYLRSIGRNVQESINTFDSEKDMISEGKKIEVKTQVPFFKMDSFTIKENQLKKCQEADELYIVQSPVHSLSYGAGDGGAGWIYMIEGKNLIYKQYKTKDGRDMLLFPRSQFKKIFKVEDENILKLMIELTSSSY